MKGIDLKNSGTSCKPLLLGRIVKFLFGDPNSKKNNIIIMNNKLSIKTSLKFRGFLVIPIFLGILFLNGGCQPNLENNESYSFLEGTTLDKIKWIHGSNNCDENTDPLIQVYKYNSSTWILRQNKCTNYEAPFMFLFAGSERALLVDTGASTSAEIFPLKQVVAELLKSWETESGIILE